MLRIYPLFTAGLLLCLFFPFVKQALIGPYDVSFWQHLLMQEGHKIFWAIPVEVKFYLVLPFLVLLFVRLLGRRPLVGLLVTVAIMVANEHLWPPGEQLYRSIALRTYLSIFLWGHLAAILHQALSFERPGPAARLGLDLFALACFVLIVMGTPSVMPTIGGALRTTFVPALGEAGYGLVWALALLAYLKSDGLVCRVLASPAMRLAGLLSFSVYMWNLVIIEWARRAFWESGGPVRVAVILVCLGLLSGASYLLVERPFIRLGFRLSRRARPALSN